MIRCERSTQLFVRFRLAHFSCTYTCIRSHSSTHTFTRAHTSFALCAGVNRVSFCRIEHFTLSVSRLSNEHTHSRSIYHTHTSFVSLSPRFGKILRTPRIHIIIGMRGACYRKLIARAHCVLYVHAHHYFSMTIIIKQIKLYFRAHRLRARERARKNVE